MTHVAIVLIFILIGAVLAGPQGARAQDFPNKSIQLVIPFPPGGLVDLVARAISNLAESHLGQPLVPVTRAGAAGAIAAQSVATARPDGYTLLFGWSGLSLIPHEDILLGRPQSFSKQDFIPITQLSTSPPLLAVHAESPWRTLPEFVDEAKRRPNQLSHSSGGLYGISHLPMELFKLSAGISLKHIPFAGGAPAMTALLGRNADSNICYPSVCLAHFRAGKIRLLAQFGTRRLPDYADVPTLKELGYNVEYASWLTIMAPARAPAPVVAKLREAFLKVGNDQRFPAQMAKIGEPVDVRSGEEFAAFWDKEYVEMGELLKKIVAK